jgi:hypothetical protein
MYEPSPIGVATKNVSIGAIPHGDNRDKPSPAQLSGDKELAGVTAIAFVCSVSQEQNSERMALTRPNAFD